MWCLPIGRDGAADCADTDCADDAACAGAENEVCGNGADDDATVLPIAPARIAPQRDMLQCRPQRRRLSTFSRSIEADKVSAILLFSLLLAGLALLRKRA